MDDVKTGNAFGQDRARSLAGLVAGVSVLLVLRGHGAITAGPDAYNAAMSSGPGLLGVGGFSGLGDWLFLGLPLAYYGLGNIRLWWSQVTGKVNLRTFEEWRAFLHAATGLFLILFVAFHAYVVWYQGSPEGVTQAQFMTGFFAASVWKIWLYVFGILALTFHVANGCWRFAVSWGFSTGEKTMDAMAVVCAILFGLTSALGLQSLATFVMYG